MRVTAVLAILLVASPFLSILSRDDAKGEGDGEPHGRAVPEISNDTLDISFEKSEYIVWNLSGNMTINITFTSKSGSDENVSVLASARTYYGAMYGGIESEFLSKRTSLLLSPYEARTLPFNLSIMPLSAYRNGHFFRTIYLITTSNDHIQSQNFTTIVSLGPYSVKIIDPVPNMGEHRVLIDTPFDVRLNVTNYSDGMLDGTIQGYYKSKKVSVGPKSSAIVSITLGSSAEQTRRIIVFSLTTIDTLTGIGFDKENGNATNITDTYLTVIFQRLLNIQIENSDLDLAEQGHINISVGSSATHTIQNLRFTVHISGWLSHRISHVGEFTIARLEPSASVNVTYNITSHVAGRFFLQVSTTLNGVRYYKDLELAIISQAGPSLYLTTAHRGARALGDKEFLNGSIINKYPYAIYNVKLTVLLENDFRDLLSGKDFMEFQPAEISIGVLESNQTEDFAFNVTFSSPGTWKLAVVALWGGNASYGGDTILQEFRVSRASFTYSPIGIVVAIVIIVVSPKVVDRIIRRISAHGAENFLCLKRR